MLDLQARVHLQKIEIVTEGAALRRNHQELQGAGVGVAGGARNPDRRLAHGFAQSGRHDGRGRFFHHLLVAALQGALALAQVDQVAVVVAQDLKLDVPRPLQVLFDVHRRVAESVLRF